MADAVTVISCVVQVCLAILGLIGNVTPYWVEIMHHQHGFNHSGLWEMCSDDGCHWMDGAQIPEWLFISRIVHVTVVTIVLVSTIVTCICLCCEGCTGRGGVIVANIVLLVACLGTLGVLVTYTVKYQQFAAPYHVVLSWSFWVTVSSCALSFVCIILNQIAGFTRPYADGYERISGDSTGRPYFYRSCCVNVY